MAHPIVEKLQNFGIRHGEKVGVAIVSALCLGMLGMALTRPSVSVSKEQIAEATTRAQQNLNNAQAPAEILAKVQGEGVVQPEFIAAVEKRETGGVDASPFALTNVMVAPEPGAGLLRETPELIRITRLEAHSGRGSIRIYDTDPDTGEIVYEVPKPDSPVTKRRARRGSAGRGGSGGMMGGMMGRGGSGGGGGAANQSSDIAKAEAERKRQAEEARLNKSIAGQVRPEEKDEVEKAADHPPGSEPKEVIRGFRWAAITGVIDNKKMRDNLARAIKVDPSAAYANYLRVDLERQEQLDNGEWSNWREVDRKFSKQNVLELLTDTESEAGPTGKPITPDEARLETLVDPLPFLEVGYWLGVHHGDLVDPKALSAPKEETVAAGPGGRGAGMGGSGGMMGSGGMLGGRGGSGGMTSGSDMEGMMRGATGGGSSGGTPSGAGGSGGMMGSGGRGGAGMALGGDQMGGRFGGMFGGNNAGGPAEPAFTKSEAAKVMVRALDFTVEQDRVYRYRARLVIRNPNYNNPNVMPGVDNGTEEMLGDWSDTTLTVSIPPDVETYVVGVPPADARTRRPDTLRFSVVRWDDATGVTVVKPFTEAPGEVVGEPDSASIPVEDKDKTKVVSRTMDFTSHRLLVDTSGDTIALERLGVGPSFYTAPARAVLLRPDGRVVIRDEAGDAVAGRLAEMVEINRQMIKDAQGGDKQSSNMFGGGMMGSGGMGSGGMMGPGGL